MKLIFAEAAWDDYLYWQQKDKRTVERINKLVKEVVREPFTGIGKPEPLKHVLSGHPEFVTYFDKSLIRLKAPMIYKTTNRVRVDDRCC